MTLFYLAYVAVFVGVGTFLLIKATMIAGWLLPKSTASPGVPPGPGSPQNLQAVAFSVVGVILASSAFPDLARTMIQYGGESHALLQEITKPGIEFVVGLLLFFQSKRLAAYWHRIRAAHEGAVDDDSGPL
jgi:hypothetical protein